MLLHKPEYANYFDVFIVVGLGFLADMTGGVNGYIINLSKYFRFTTYFIVSAVIICAITNWVLIPQIGMMGAAIAYFTAMLALNFMYWLYVKVKFNLQPFGKAHFLILIISILTLIVGIYIPAFTNVWVDMVVRSAVVVLMYGLFTWVFKVSDDINLLINGFLKTNNNKSVK